MTECEAKSTSSWAHRILSWQLSRDVNSHGSGVSHGTTASPKPSFRTPWRMDDAVVGRGNAGWTTSKSGHPCSCQSCTQGSHAEKTGRGSLLNRPSCPSDNQIGQGAELNCRELRTLTGSLFKVVTSSSYVFHKGNFVCQTITKSGSAQQTVVGQKTALHAPLTAKNSAFSNFCHPSLCA